MEMDPKRANKQQSTKNITSYGNGGSITSRNCQNKKQNWKHGIEFGQKADWYWPPKLRTKG